MRPLIGIGTSYHDGRLSQRREYADGVAAAGGAPVLLPVVAPGDVEALALHLDGLVIPGGPGITRGMEGALPDDLEATARERVDFDETVARHFLESDKPILGICYGMQLLNALAGGTIYADVERDREGSTVHSHKRGGDVHAIAVEPETALARIFVESGESSLTAGVEVNTRHIQAVREVGAGYRISARAPDGVVEAIEDDDARVIGVQFHPELMAGAGLPLFRHLVGRAGRGRPRRDSV